MADDGRSTHSHHEDRTRVDTRIVWFRRDLRLHDHAALHAGLVDADSDAPACLDQRLRTRGGRTGWMHNRPRMIVDAATHRRTTRSQP